MSVDYRQQLADSLVKEMLEEIDADTIRRYNLGQRLLPVGSSYEWFYIVDEKGNVILNTDENGRLN